MKSVLDLLFALTFAWVMALTSARGLGSAGDQSSSSFGKGLKSSDFQGWSDWLHKRSSPFGADPWSNGNFQQWNDWMAKRNLGMQPEFGSPTMFQKWNEWMAKRGLGGTANGNNGFGSPMNFQKWNEWMAKRALGTGGQSPFSGLDNGQFQGWSEWLSKRMIPVSGGDFAKGTWSGFGSSKYLSPSLQDWRKATHKRADEESEDQE